MIMLQDLDDRENSRAFKLLGVTYEFVSCFCMEWHEPTKVMLLYEG
jgi:hypothetical protein